MNSIKLFCTVAAAFVISGCAAPAVPVRQTFPEAPAALMERCPQLKTIDRDRGTMKEFLMVVVENYATYYQCADRTHAWQDWHRETKKIYDGAAK